MKLCRFLKKSAVLLMALLMLSGFGTTAFAHEMVDTDRETSLTVYFGKDGADFDGAEFRLYRVAEVSETVRFTLTGDFADYPVAVNDLDSSGWRALAQTLDAYVMRDGLKPLQAGKTGEDGRVRFDGMPTGLYLVVGEPWRNGGYTYTPEPFLVSLPNPDGESDGWIYDREVSCKYDSTYCPPEDSGGTVSRKVLKVWNDDGNRQERPEEIVVQLLRDGQIWDTVTLSGKNNWRYTWNDLDSDYQWQVAEYETPEGYTVSVDREGVTFVMTNTYTEEFPEEPAPQGPDKPELPLTGMLWWPVPVLACGGLFLFLIGWGVMRRGKK